jgi:hypothetical protein
VQRQRKADPEARLLGPQLDFVNPYPYMSSIEAMVHLELERRKIPFSWRFFDADSPLLKQMLPDFAPEFTLREHKTVILIIGDFWGLLPAVLDLNALAQAILEEEGWTVVTLFENEIRTDLQKAISTKAPQLDHPVVTGPMRANPYGIPDFMEKRRAQLRGQGLARRVFRVKGGTRRADRKRNIRLRRDTDGRRIRRSKKPRFGGS